MASRMKLATLLALAAIAVTWLRLVPVEPRPAPASAPAAGEERLAEAVGRAFEMDAVLRRARWEDSLRTVMAEATPEEGGVVHGYPGHVSEATRSLLADAVARHAPHDAAAPPVLAGFFSVPTGQGGHPGLAALPDPGARPGVEWYAGTLEEGAPYCFQLSREVRDGRGLPRLETPVRDGEALGPCRYWYRYGPPGGRIHGWIRSGAFGFTVLDSLPARARPLDDPLYRLLQEPLGLMELTTDGYRCVSGDTDRCASMVFDETSLAGSFRRGDRFTPRIAAGATGFVGSVGDARSLALTRLRGGVEGLILTTLERDFGRDRFARFWRSELAPAAAFRASFGVEPGAWVRDFYRGYFGVRSRGPSPVRSGLAPLGLLVLACLAVAALTASRRRLG